MVKVMQAIKVYTIDEEKTVVISATLKEYETYSTADYAARVVADMDPLNNDEIKRMRLVGSELYYDPDKPLKTVRSFTYRLGSVFYVEQYFLEA